MSTGMRIAKFAGIIFLCLGSLSFAVDQHSTPQHTSKKAKKPAPLPPLPSGPTGPVPQIPLDSIAPVLPQVSYENGQLTIVASNSTLGDILRAVRKQTGAEIDVPDAKERVVTHLGPGPAREVIADLLNGSRFNYVLLGSPDNNNVLTKVVLVQKSGPETVASNQPGMSSGGPSPRHPNEIAQQPQPEEAMDTNDAEAPPEENADENADQPAAAEAEQPVANPDQQGVKTPQQLLQEMQQRQLQIQQQQQNGQYAPQPGQPPIPGQGPVQQQPQQPQQQ
jgi:hypothetical protein